MWTLGKLLTQPSTGNAVSKLRILVLIGIHYSLICDQVNISDNFFELHDKKATMLVFFI